MMITGFSDRQKLGPSFSNANYIVKNSLAYMDIFNCEGVNVLELYATGAYVFLLTEIFQSDQILHILPL